MTTPEPRAGRVEESYALAPLQAGMLFHALDAGDSGVDVEQITCCFDEKLDSARLRQAWQAVVARHAVLRTRFSWQKSSEPRQEVLSEAPLAWAELEWRDGGEAAQESRWAELLASDRQRGFDLSQLPLMRLTLVVLGARRYQLLWTFHHILLDGRSFPILLREVFALYAALRDGVSLTLPATRPYKQFIDWLGEKKFDRAESYWRTLLKGLQAPPRIDLPSPIEATAGRGQGVVESKLSLEASLGLSDFAKGYGLTVNTLLQGAWALLLHHYTGADDVIFGATRACRHSPLGGAQDMVGLFINTLPLRVRVDPDEPLLPWLGRLRDQQIAVRDYEHTPLIKVQEWSAVPAGTALFESILVFENQSLDSMMRAGAGDGRQRRFEYRGQTNYPLTLIAYNDHRLLLRLEYDRSRYSDDVGERLLAHLQNLLEGMVGTAERKLGDVPVLTAAERCQLVARRGAESAPYAVNRCLHEMFEAQVERTPDAIAVSCEGQQLSYGELNRRANRLTRRLRAAGVGADVLVGLCAERSIELVLGILAIHKAGGAYLPLDPNYPAERLAFMISDAQVKIVLAQERFLGELAQNGSAGLRRISLDGDPDGLDAAEDENLPSVAAPDNLAYVIYTSGSTGQPKGALISHSNVVRLFQATERHYRFGASDVWTLFHSYAFDFSVWEIWGALLYGGRIVVVPYAVSRSPEEFTALLQQERVTVLNQTPSAFRQLIPSFTAAVPVDRLALRYVIFGGEALELQSLQPWFERYGDEQPQVINMYGITETTVHVTYRRIRHADLRAGTGSVIGTPLADLHAYLLNARKQLVPPGVAGELYIGGAGVARGYLRRPELTAEKFMADPFSGSRDGRLYRSGDLARRLPYGDLEYLGRIDDQVKIRGFRIELGEIEAVLGRHADVKAAAVIAREDAPGDKRLVAYVVPRGSFKVDELRESVCAALPDYMVPAAFVEMESLPLTANGKLDRKALPAPDPLRTELRQDYRPPCSDNEVVLCGIWQSVLGVSRVGIDDNFFELGGDSILSIQVISRARQAGLNLATRDLFKHPTIAGLAATVSTARAVNDEPAQASGAVLLTPIQQWFFEQELTESHHWNQSFLFATAADFDLAVCEAALQHVGQHHDAFRLCFNRVGEVWQQSHRAEAESIVLERIDLSELPVGEQEEALQRTAAAVQASLNISAGPMVKAAHFKLSAGGRLLLVLHHLIIDAVSWRILLEDLETAYTALRSQQAVELPGRTASFQSWSARLGQHAGAAETRDELTTWRAVTDGAGAWLPGDLDPDGANLEASAQTVRARLSEAETRVLLQQLPAAYRTQINEILLAALAESFKGWHPADRIVIDLEGHGREELGDDIDLSRTIGWFTTIFPVALDLRSADLPAALRAVKNTLRRLRHHGLNYGVLRYLSDDAAVRGALSGTPQAEVAFNYLGQMDQLVANSRLFRFAPESCGPQHSPAAQRRHKLEVLAQVEQGRFELRWIYSANLHRQATIERLASKFVTALRALIAQSETRAAAALAPVDFPLAEIDQPTLDRLLRNYPATEDLYPLSPVQNLFLSADAADGSLGLEQWHGELIGPLDVAAFKQAWQALAERHTILRSAFVSEGLAESLAIVNAAVTLPWLESDWRGASREEQQQRFSAFLERDRELGFQLDQAPLMRLALMRLAEDRYQFVWTTHHLLIDGWSWPLVFKELAATYDAATCGQAMPATAACPYRRYIAWLKDQPLDAAETFWRQELTSIKAPTRLMPADVSSARRARGLGEERFTLDAQTTQALQDYARSHQVTLNSMVHAAWALVLGRLSGSNEVVFGATFSGRPADVAGMDAMVGPCITNLPVRLRLPRQESLADWLRHHQEHLGEVGQFQYVSPMEIQGWSEIPWRERLFESLLVFQNYQTDDCDKQFGRTLTIDKLVGPYTTNYPMTVVITPGVELKVWLVYQTPQFEAAQVAPVAAALRDILAAWAMGREVTWAQLMGVADSLALPAASGAAPASDSVPATQMVAPQNERQRRLLEIWCDAFQRDAIGIDDNFFDLGGHSVLMVQTHKRLRQVLQRDLSIVKMFQYPTIRALAQFLDGGSEQSSIHEQLRQRAEKQRAALGRRLGRGDAITTTRR